MELQNVLHFEEIGFYHSGSCHFASLRKVSSCASIIASAAAATRSDFEGETGRMINASPDDSARIDYAFKRLACRPADEVERTALAGLLAKLRERYKQAPAEANKLLAVGGAPRDEKLDAVEHAAWTQVAATVLASDVAILLY